MLNFLSSQNPLGINISDSSIKLAQIGNKGTLRVVKKMRLPEGAVVNGEIIKDDETADILRELIKETDKIKNISTKEAAFSLPEKITYLKIINLPRPAGGGIEKEIYAEAVKYIPEEVDNLYIDWQIINKNKKSSEPLEIIIGAGEKNIIENYIKVIEKAGLSPIILEPESLSIARALLHNENKAIYSKEPPKTVKKDAVLGILDIGSKSSSFIVYNGIVKFNTVIPFSDEKIVKSISTSLNITDAQAKKAKIKCGMNDKKAKGGVKKILEPLIEEVAKNIKKIEEYYIDYQNGGKFDKIILCGGGASLELLDKVLEEKTKIKTEIGNAKINLQTNAKKLNPLELLQYESAIGLALIGYWTGRN